MIEEISRLASYWRGTDNSDEHLVTIAYLNKSEVTLMEMDAFHEMFAMTKFSM